MHLERAKRLQPGQSVSCPEDRNQPAYTGKVKGVGSDVNISHQGQEYLWVEVKTPFGHCSVWPSNRLG